MIEKINILWIFTFIYGQDFVGGHLYTEKKSYGTKPKKGFVHATKSLKGLLVCNEFETLF